MKKVLIAVLVVIVALVACYYAFPEKVAGYMMDAAISHAGLTKKEIKIDDHNIVYLEGGDLPQILVPHVKLGFRHFLFLNSGTPQALEDGNSKNCVA